MRKVESHLKRIVSWWKHRQVRKAAKKYDLDFEHRCCFPEQVIGIGEGLKYGCGEIVRVLMQSGKIALYKVTSRRVNYSADDTGQRHWLFEFQGYAN